MHLSQKQPLFSPFYQRLIWLVSILMLLVAILGIGGIWFFSHWHLHNKAQYHVNEVKRLASPLLSLQAVSATPANKYLSPEQVLDIDCQAQQPIGAMQAIIQRLQQLKNTLQVELALLLHSTCVSGSQHDKSMELLHHTLPNSPEYLIQNIQTLDFQKALLPITLDTHKYHLGHLLIKDIRGNEAGRLLVFMLAKDLSQAVYTLAIWAIVWWLLLILLLFSIAIMYLWYFSQRVPAPLSEDCKHELDKMLEVLEISHQELLKAEKMASLGKLLAGVAHEINTPLSAIHSSVNHLNMFWQNVLKRLPAFFHNLSEPQQSQLINLLDLALAPKTPISSRQERQNKRALRRALDIANIDDADTVADKLSDMGIYHASQEILILLRDREGIHILSMAHKLLDALYSTQTIHIAIERANKIVLALKSFAHYEHEAEKTTINIVDGIEIALTLYQNIIKQGVEVVRDYQEIPAVPCYPDELIQVWTNLIHNALQAMENQLGTLSINTRHIEQRVSVSISDTGKGIPADLHKKVFEPFFTTKPSGEGSGMGLEIVKKIVQRHGGSIELQSVENQGCTFIVYLPLR